jgi:elongator complex protein 4
VPPSAKLSVLRGLAPGSESTSAGAGGMDNNLAFRLKRRRFVVETLHLGVDSEGTMTQKPKPKRRTERVSREEELGIPADGREASPEVSVVGGGGEVRQTKVRFGGDVAQPKRVEIRRDKPELYEF